MYVNTCCGNNEVIQKNPAIQIDKNRDRYIDRLSADSRPKYRTAIFWLSTKCRPTIDRVLTNYWLIHQSRIDQLSAKCPRKVGEVSVKYRCTKSFIGRDTSGTTIDRLSTLSRPSVDRLSTVISTEYRPIIDRLSTAISTDWSVDIPFSKHKTDWDLGTRLGIN